MEAHVNDACIGCGLCTGISPSVFKMTDEGVAAAKDEIAVVKNRRQLRRVVKQHRAADAIRTLGEHQLRRDAAVNAAAHGDQRFHRSQWPQCSQSGNCVLSYGMPFFS